MPESNKNDMENKDLNCEDGACEVPVSTVSEENREETKNAVDRLIYVGDPMCSWCWGITNHLEQLKEEYSDHFGFELLLGGLRPGGGHAWTQEFRDMIRSHWEHVQTASGQSFDFSFFDREQFNYDTEPSARAVRVVRDLDASKEWSFFKRLQRAFYAENLDIHNLATYELLCHELGIDYKPFETLFLSPGYKQLVNQDFVKAQQMGVTGFPAVILKRGVDYHAVSMGYSDYDRMKSTMERIIAG